jgi:putative FmdB family regulatory protein
MAYPGGPVPTYEYQCDSCGKTFNVIRPILAGGRAVPCPRCRSRKTRQRFGAFYAKTVRKS